METITICFNNKFQEPIVIRECIQFTVNVENDIFVGEYKTADTIGEIILYDIANILYISREKQNS